MMSDQPRTRRHSPAVYRRRRLVLIVAAVAVIAVVWLLIAQPWSGAADTSDPAPSPSRSASASPSATPTPSPESSPTATAVNPGDAMPDASVQPEDAPPAEVEACTAGDVLVEPLTDKESYAAGEQPQISLRLTNRGAEACSLNVGTTQQVYTVTSGDDTWWRSTDCQSEPSDMVVTLSAGQVVESATPIAWDRTRSSVDTCDGGRPQAPGGGASFHVAVSIGGIEGRSTKQIFLY
jgi:cytoskeletal protein RodZ